MKIDVIIVNWNSGYQLKKALESLEKSDKKGFELDRVVVVDNNSSDGSIKGLEDIELPLKIIKNDDNYGFASACNTGAEGSRADLLIFMNPDASVYKDTLIGVVSWMCDVSNRQVGVCGVQLVDESGGVSRTSTRQMNPVHVLVSAIGLNKLMPRYFRNHFMQEWSHDATRSVQHVIGAFYVIRRDLFESLNGFDSRFFVYLEDLDLSRRVLESGYKIYYLAGVKAFHLGGGTSDQVKDKRLFYSLSSRIVYGYKHYSKPTALALAAVTLLVEPIIRLLPLLVRGNRQAAQETMRGFKLLWRHAPALLAGRPPVRPVRSRVRNDP